MSVLSSLLLLWRKKSKRVTRNKKIYCILHSLVCVWLQRFPVITTVGCVTRSHVSSFTTGPLLCCCNYFYRGHVALHYSEPVLHCHYCVSKIFPLLLLLKGELPVAEDWTICIEVCGTESSLAPHRYLDTAFSLNFEQNYQTWQNKMKVVCEYFFVYPGSSLLTGSDSLQLWSHVDRVKDEDEEGKQTEIIMKDSHSGWRCTWQSK